jgi:chromosome segregation ATPase
MTKVMCSLAIALLLTTVHASPLLAVTELGTPQVNSRNSAVLVPAPHVPPAAGAPAQQAAATGAASKTAGGAKTAEPIDPSTVEMTKLKYQIKTTRLSLADTQGRLAVTEKDLAATTSENAQVRSENTQLRVGLTKAETVAQKSEEELGHRRQEMMALQSAKPSHAGVLAVGFITLIITVFLAVGLSRQSRKLNTVVDRMDADRAQDKRHEQVRTQLKDEQQRSQRLEEEIKHLRTAAESQVNVTLPAGSKRDKLEHMRRELREARAAAEAEKRQADERIQNLEAELARIAAERSQIDERFQKLEPEMALLATEKQEVREQLEKLEPEVERLTTEKVEAEERSRGLAKNVARLTAEKLRLEHALAKANEKLVFLGQDEPEDTLPPVVG